MEWYVYILECKDGALYTGLTDNVERRFHEHTSGKGGIYTERNKPNELLYYEAFNNRVNAENRERQIKHWTKAKKKAPMSKDFNKLRQLSISKD